MQNLSHICDKTDGNSYLVIAKPNFLYRWKYLLYVMRDAKVTTELKIKHFYFLF